MTVHQNFVADIAAHFGLRPIIQCFQTKWSHEYPPILAPNPVFNFHALEVEQVDEVAALYSYDIGVDYIYGRVAAGEMFGALGSHSTIAILHIFSLDFESIIKAVSEDTSILNVI